MGIWQIAILTLVKRKKMFVLLTTIVAFSILTIITLSITIDGINQIKLEKTYKTYGKHHVILHDITDYDREYISNLEEIHTFSEYALVGTTNINLNNFETDETLGWIDSSTLELGRINLIEGKLPSRNNEIAVESFYSMRGSENKKIGTKVDIEVGGNTEKFEIVGIISDYSMNWAASPNVVKGVNDFPNIFLYKGDLLKFGVPSYHVLINFKGSLKEVENSFFLIREYLDSQESTVNEFLFKSLATTKTTQSVSMLFQILLWVTSTVCILHVFNLYYFNYRIKISIFRAYGAPKSKILTIILLQCLTVLFISTIISIPFSFILMNLITTLTLGEVTAFLSSLKVNFVKLIIWLGLTFISILIGALYPLTLQLKLSIVENIKFLNKYSFKFLNKVNFSFWFKYLCIQIISSVKHTVLIILTLSLGTLLMFLGQVYVKETTGISETNVDFYINSQTWQLKHQYYGFPIPLSQGPIFDSKKIEELEQFHGIDYIDKRPLADGVSLLLTKNQLNSSVFLKNWVNNFKFPDSTDISIPSRENLGIASDLHVIPNVDFIILNNNELEKLNKQYFNNSLNKLAIKNNPHIIIFIPLEEKIEDQLGISNGEIIKLGQIKNFNSSEEIIYKEWELTAAHIIPSHFSLEINEHIKKDSSRITIVLHEDINKKLNIFRGFSEVVVYLNEKVNTNELIDIELKTKKIVSSIPGSLYQSITELANEEKANSKSIRILTFFLFISTVSFSIISIVAVVYGRFLLKQKEWGTLRALGITKKQINVMFFLQITIYIAISSLLVFSFVIFFLLRQPLYGEALLYFSYFLYSILFVFFLAVIATIFLFKIINKSNISSLIRSIV